MTKAAVDKGGKAGGGRGGGLRYVFYLLVIAGLAALAFFLYRGGCGKGFGLGGGDAPGSTGSSTSGDASGQPSASSTAPVPPCKLRLGAAGLERDGKASSVEDAVAACRLAGTAELVVTGDARFGELERVRAALAEAKVRVLEQR